MRLARAGLLLVLGVLFAVGSWGPLHNLVSDYQDSPTWVYWLYGGPLLALALICFAGSWLALRGR
jgi:hypothetical protein